MNYEVEQNSYGLETIHKSLLKALIEFDKICRNNDVSYALYGGTMLGAERNKKFIPWDDDADICMTRNQYEKLYNVISNNNSKCYIDTSKLWVPRFIFKDEDGVVFVDIFIWDYISEVKWQRICKIQGLRFLQGMMKTNVDYQRYGWKYKVVLFVSAWIGKLFSQKSKAKFYENVSKNWFLGRKEYIHCANEMFKGVAFVFDKDYMEDYIDVEFEEKIFMSNRRFREILIKYYGEDYMTPPPIEERRPAHQGQISRLNGEME